MRPTLYITKREPHLALIFLAASGLLGLRELPTISAALRSPSPKTRRQMETVLAVNGKEQTNHWTYGYDGACGNKHNTEITISQVSICFC